MTIMLGQGIINLLGEKDESGLASEMERDGRRGEDEDGGRLVLAEQIPSLRLSFMAHSSDIFRVGNIKIEEEKKRAGYLGSVTKAV